MKLYGEPGWGSALVEAQLDWYGTEYDLERVGDLFESLHARQNLARINPIAQVPTLVLGDGTIMTESAAITLYLAELAQNDTLVPPAHSAQRAAFLRWLIFIVANIYPTYTYADDPARFVHSPDAQPSFRNTVNEYAIKMYVVLENHASQPWFLGERFSALDIYIGTMTRWRPGRAWFAEHAPKLFSIASATDEVDSLKATRQRNFPNK